MSGIIIDVDTRAESAKRDLTDLNKSLAALVKNSQMSAQGLGGIKTENLRKLSQQTNAATRSFDQFKETGTKSLNSVDKSASGLSSTFASLRNAAILLGTSFLALRGVSGFNKMADELTQIQNRLKLVTDGTDELMKKQAQLYQLSKATRSSFAATASVFVDFSKSLEQTSMSQTRILGLTKTIQQSAALSGSSAESIKGALVQMGQGLAAGVIRGEEFNSIMEQMKYLGTSLPKAFGMSSGAFRAFVMDGQLTAAAFADALEKMAEQTEKDFKKTVFTVEQSVQRLSAAFTYAVGDFNKFFGFSDKFAARLQKFASAVDSANSVLLAELVTFKQGIKNYIDGFNMFDAFELTVRGALKLEISPLDAYDKYQQYKFVKEQVASVKKFFGIKDKVEIKTKRPAVEGVDPRDLEVPEVSGKPLVETFKNLRGIAYEAFRFIGIGFSNIAALFPSLLGPVKTLATSVRQMFTGIMADANAAVYDAVMPFGRALQGISEYLLMFSNGDTRLERAWVNMFKSDSLEAFAENLKNLNDIRKDIKLDDKEFLFEESLKGIRSAGRPIEDLLISLNLVDNRLLSIKHTNFNRVIEYFDNLRRVIARIYQDVFATTVEPIVAKIGASMLAFGRTILDALNDILTEDIGYVIGKTFTNGLKRAFGFFKGLLARDFDLSDQLFGKSTGEKIKDGIIGAVKAVGSFVEGVIRGIGDSISDSISPNAFKRGFRAMRNQLQKEIAMNNSVVLEYGTRAMESISDFKFKFFFDFDKSLFDKSLAYILDTVYRVLDLTLERLAETEAYIRNFGTRVKDIFFDIYDAVVGHSYWPDMVDGVVAYTERLFEAEGTIQKFGEKVKNAFSNIYQSVIASSGTFGTGLRSFIEQIANTDWSAAFRVMTNSLGATILAGLALAFGDLKLKASAISYFLTLFNTATEGALNTFVPLIGEALGGSLAIMTQHITEGVIHVLDAFVAAAPSFLSGIAAAFSPMIADVTSLIGKIPILGSLISNNLYSAILVAAGAYALLAKKGVGNITDFLFGKDKKKGRQDGLMDYLMPMLGMSKQGNSRSLIDAMFPSKKLALAAAGAFSTALLDSVSFLDAATFGVPLLGFAMLGKDGGARFARDTSTFAIDMVGKVYSQMSRVVTSLLGQDHPLAKLLQFPIDALTGPSGPKSALATAFANVASTFKRQFDNLDRNISDYTAGRMSLWEAFTTSATASVGPAPQSLNGAFSHLMDEIGNTFSAGYNKIKSKNYGAGLLGSISTSATGVFSTISSSAKTAFDLFSTGLMALAGLARKYFVVIAGIAALFASTSFAASGAAEAVGTVANSFIDVLAPVLAVTTAVMALGKAMKLLDVYKNAQSDFMSNLLPKGLVSKQNKEMTDTLKGYSKEIAPEFAARHSALMKEHAEKMALLKKEEAAKIAAAIKRNPDARLGDALRKSSEIDVSAASRKSLDAVEATMTAEMTARMHAKAAALEAVQAAERAKFTIGQDGKKAGMDAVKAEFVAMLGRGAERARAFGMGLLTVVKSPAMAAMWWSEKVASMSSYVKTNIMTEVATARITLANKALAESFALLKLGKIAEGFKLLGSSMATLTAASFGMAAASTTGAFAGMAESVGGIAGIIAKLRGGIASLMGMLGKFAMLLWPLIKIPLLIAAAAATVGALGLWLFGPGNSFIANLEWAYDKVKSFFGLAPTTKAGREIEVSSLLSSRKVGVERADFTKELANIDYAKLSDVQVKVLMEMGQTTKEGLDNIEKAVAKQGYMDTDQQAEAKRIIDETRAVLQRQTPKADATLGSQLDDFNKKVKAIDSSLWTMFKNFVGYTPIVDEATRATTQIQQAMMYLKARFLSWPSLVLGAVGMLGGPIGAAIGVAIGMTMSAIWDWIVSSTSGLVDGIGYFFNELNKSMSLAWEVAGDYLTGAGIGAAIGTIIGMFFTPLGAALGATIGSMLGSVVGVATVAVVDVVKSFWTDVVEAFSKKPTKKELADAAEINKSSEKAKKYENYLPAEVQTLLTGKLGELTNLQETVKALESRGWTGIEEKTRADFDKKLKSAREQLSSTREEYLRYSKLYGNFGEENFNIEEFTKRVKKLSSEAKQYLDLDIGKTAEDFSGNANDVKELQALIEKAKVLKFNESRAFNIDDRRIARASLKNVEKEAAELKARVAAELRFEANIEFVVKTTGIDVAADDLRRLAFTARASYDTFTGIGKEISKLETDLANAINDGAGPDVVRSIVENIGKAKLDAIATAFTQSDFDSLNKQLQAAGLGQLNVNQYLSMAGTEASGLATQMDSIRSAKQRLENSIKSGKPFETWREDLKRLREETLTAAAMIKSQLAQEAGTLAKDKNNPLGVTNLIGGELPAVASTTVAGLTKYNSLTAKRLSLESNLAEFQRREAVGLPNATAEVVKNQKALLGVNDALAKLEERNTFTLEGMLGIFSGAGIGIDSTVFSGLTTSLQKELIDIGRIFDQEQRTMGDTDVGKYTGDRLDKMLKSQQARLKRAQEIVLTSTLVTGDKLKEAFSNIGLTSFETVSNAAVTGFYEAAKAIEAMKIGLKGTVNTADTEAVSTYIGKLRELTVAERKLAEGVEDANQTFATRLSSFNEMFGTSLKDSEFLGFGPAFATRMGDAARLAKRELENVYRTGKTSSGEAGEAFIKSFEKLQKAGPIISFFSELRNNFSTALTEGAKAGFERIKSALPELGFDSKVFERLGAPERRNLSGQASALDALKRAAELPNLGQGALDILNNFRAGDDPSKTLKDLRSSFIDSFGKGLEQLLKSPTEMNTDALSSNTQAIHEWIAAIKGEPSAAKGGKVGAGVKFNPDGTPATGNGGVNPGFYKESGMATKALSESVEKSLGSAATIRENIAARMPGIDKVALDRATPTQLTVLNGWTAAFREKSLAIEGAATESIPGIRNSMEEYRLMVNDLTDQINRTAAMSMEAGKGFASSVTSGFTSSLTGILKGKADEGRSVLETGIRSFLDVVTNKVIDTFVEGLTEKMISTFGLDTMLKTAGSSIFSFLGFASGGYVSGSGTSTSDSIPAMLSNGEFVVNAAATKEFGPLLHSINSGGFGRLSGGGLVGAMAIGPGTVPVTTGTGNNSTSNQVINLNITGDISRQTRAEIYSMLPSIAAGVNTHNHNRGYKG